MAGKAAPRDLRELPPESLVSPADVCRIAGIGRTTLFYLVREEKIPQPIIRQHRCVRWRLGDVRDWLDAVAEAGSFR